MKQLDNLPEIAGKFLGGLHADTQLKQRILEKAAGKTHTRPLYLRPAFGAALSLVVIIAGVFLLSPKPNAPDAPVIHSIAAGQGDIKPQTRAMLDLPRNSVGLFTTSDSAASSIWAPAQGADFPLIAASGKFYRLMESPSTLHESLLGEALGEIQEYTSEPSLSATDTIFSNAAAQGETVYAVSGMNGASVAAKVNGTLRTFQRVSYAGKGRVGNETLADTLKISGKVTVMELSGYESITDAQRISELLDILLNNATYENATLLDSDTRLLLQLDSGMVMQLMVKGDTLSACGSWSCPEFFEAFSQGS